MPSTKRDDRPVEREFTLEEANAAVEELRPLVRRMVEHGQALSAAQRAQLQLVTRIAGNGGDMQPSDLGELAETIQREADAVAGFSIFPRIATAKRFCSAGNSGKTTFATGTASTKDLRGGSRCDSEGSGRLRRHVRDVARGVPGDPVRRGLVG